MFRKALRRYQVINLDKYSCCNAECKHYNLFAEGNIAVRAKYGINKDRYLLYCKTCGKTFAATRDTPLFKSHLPQDTVTQIIKLSAEGVGIRSMARILGISTKAVMSNIARLGEHCDHFLDDLVFSLDLQEVQLDELWTFVKKKRSDSGQDASKEGGQRWIWTAIDATSRLLFFGGRGKIKKKPPEAKSLRRLKI
jgi:transposase-like protein